MVVWNSQDQDGSDIGVFGQRFNADGEAVGDEFQVNTTTDNRQYRPTVTGLLMVVLLLLGKDKAATANWDL